MEILKLSFQYPKLLQTYFAFFIILPYLFTIKFQPTTKSGLIWVQCNYFVIKYFYFVTSQLYLKFHSLYFISYFIYSFLKLNHLLRILISQAWSFGFWFNVSFYALYRQLYTFEQKLAITNNSFLGLIIKLKELLQY